MKTWIAVLAVVIIAALAVGGYYISRGMGSGNTTVYSSTVYTSVGPGTSQNTTASSTYLTTIPGGQNSTQYTVMIMHNSTIGNYLTNGAGFTLYFFRTDIQNSGTSACNGSCAGIWPPFYASTLTLPPALSASSFNTIIRSDGTKQLTYYGWPLYLYAPDTAPGSIKGEGIGKVWYAYQVP
jgi:predicted lipoprotein with Yx(FWY)xxD motif